MNVIVDILGFILLTTLLLFGILVVVTFGIVLIGAIVIPLLKEIGNSMRK